MMTFTWWLICWLHWLNSADPKMILGRLLDYDVSSLCMFNRSIKLLLSIDMGRIHSRRDAESAAEILGIEKIRKLQNDSTWIKMNQNVTFCPLWKELNDHLASTSYVCSGAKSLGWANVLATLTHAASKEDNNCDAKWKCHGRVCHLSRWVPRPRQHRKILTSWTRSWTCS